MGKNHIYPQGPHRLRSLQPELTAVWGHKWIYSEHRMRTVAEPCRRPCSLHWCEIRTGAPTISMTHSAGRAAALVSNFPLEDSSLREEQSLCWGRYNVANVSLLLLPSHALLLECFFPSPLHSSLFLIMSLLRGSPSETSLLILCSCLFPYPALHFPIETINS